MLAGACCDKGTDVGNVSLASVAQHPLQDLSDRTQDIAWLIAEVDRLTAQVSEVGSLAARVAVLEESLRRVPVPEVKEMKEVKEVPPAEKDKMEIKIVEAGGSIMEIEVEKVVEEPAEPADVAVKLSESKSNSGAPRPVQLLRESFWDAIFILGLGGLDVATTFLVVIGTLVSVLLQSLFCWVVFVGFLSDDPKYDPDYLRDWRLLVGHALKGYDENSDSSMVSKACLGKPFDREWWAHSLLDEIDAYLTPMVSEEYCVGFILSSMAVAIWLAYISKELQRVTVLVMNLTAIPTGQTLVVDTATLAERKGFGLPGASTGSVDVRYLRSFQSMSQLRKVMLLLVMFARAALAMLLGFLGALWLSRTRDIENIIQNGVSLVFVLEIDELFFELFAPRHASRFMTSMARFESQGRKAWVYNLASLLQLAVFVLVVALFVSQEVGQNTMSAQDVKDIMCGGNKDFIIESHKTVGPMMVFPTTPFVQEEGNLANKMLPGILPFMRDVAKIYKWDEQYAQDRMWRATHEKWGDLAVKHLPDVATFRQWFEMTEFEAADAPRLFYGNNWGNTCEDQGPELHMNTFWEGQWLWSTARVLTNATDCLTATKFCENKTLPLIRMLCPVTCRCNSGTAGQFLSTGCRLPCLTETENYMNSSCEDFDQQDVMMKDAWDHWWAGFYHENLGFWADDNPLMVFAKNGSNEDCSILTSQSWVRGEFCFHFHDAVVNRRPLSPFCPITCGCTETPRPSSPVASSRGLWCPSTC